MPPLSSCVRFVPWLALVFGVPGCAFVSNKAVDDQLEQVDADGDGVPGRYDCDDTDPRKRPGDRDDLANAPAGPQDWEDPTWEDIPFDGIDNDCVDGDTVDADRDQFPGISRTAYAIAAVNAGLYSEVSLVPWPTNVSEEDVDCDDGNGAIFPEAPDDPYNGIDEDCARNNDYDADGDGQMRPSENPEAVTAYAASIGITIDVTDPNAFGDCQDLDPAVFSGNPLEVPYDGQDSDCDGTNDFDRDGDGYRPSGFDAEFAAFVALYHPTDPPAWVALSQPGDCLDMAVGALPGVDPALVNPGITTDDPYDGVDADCAGDTDFDADGDGYTVQGFDQAIEDYDLAWSTGAAPAWQPTILAASALPGDCDDTQSTVAPGNLEVLGDEADSDCDGVDDSTPFAYSTLAWDRPGWPRVVRNADHYLVLSNATWTVRRTPIGAAEFPHGAMYAFFSADPTGPDLPGYRAEPLNVRLWANSNAATAEPQSAALDVVSVGQTMFVGNAYYTASNNSLKMGFVQRHFTAASNEYLDAATATRSGPFDGYDADVETTLLQDNASIPSNEGFLWMTMCGEAGRLDRDADPDPNGTGAIRQMVIRTPFTSIPTAQVIPLGPGAGLGGGGGQLALPTGRTGDVCWHELQRVDADTLEATVHVCDVDGCSVYESSVVDTDPGPAVAYQGSFAASVDPSPYDGRGVIDAEVHDDLLVLVESAGVVVEALGGAESWTVFAGEPAISADAVLTSDGILYVAAVIEAAPLNELRLAYGPADDLAALATVTLPVTDDNPVFVGGLACTPATGVGCEPGRLLEPRRIGLHADEQRVALAVSAWTPAGYVPAEPIYGALPGRQDAVGWAFFGPALAPVPPVP